MPKLSARQIEVFLAVMNYGSVTAAAASLNVSQPSVSRILERFEIEAGFKAFDRRKGRIFPTTEAELFHREVKFTYEGLDYLNVVAKEIREHKRGFLRIGVFPGFANSWITNRLDKYIKGKDDVRVSVIPIPSSNIIEAVSRQTIDIGISLLASDRYGLQCEQLATIDSVCILDSSHPLCKKEIINASDLSGEKFISLSNLEKSRSTIDHLFDNLGMERRISIVSAQASSICFMVARGFGLSIVNRVTAEEYKFLGYEIREFFPSIEHNYYLISSTNKPSSGLINEFRQMLLDESHISRLA